jgi:adenylate cyclase
LLVRAIIAGVLITGCAAIFEIYFQPLFTRRPFIFLVLVRSVIYTVIISFWLCIINGFWGMIDYNSTFWAGIRDYVSDDSYLVNLLSVFLFLIVFVGFRQINSLHRKGELVKFIIGRYHSPREVERIFCFIDLKSSTTIAEQLGHQRFASFIKEYYSDITEAIRRTDAEIYQYVGDEIILSWSYKNGLRNNNMIRCFFLMQNIMQDLRDKYLKKYGSSPEFKAGIHGGRVMVTWVGELKREIVYLGDVLNTTARIQESCNRLSRDFLISKDLLDSIGSLNGFRATFVEEMIPRGKEQRIQLFSLEPSM